LIKINNITIYYLTENKDTYKKPDNIIRFFTYTQQSRLFIKVIYGMPCFCGAVEHLSSRDTVADTVHLFCAAVKFGCLFAAGKQPDRTYNSIRRNLYFLFAPFCIYGAVLYFHCSCADDFMYAFGLNPRLEHIPAVDETGSRGEVTHVYALYKLVNGGYGFEVMSKTDIDRHAEKYSKSFASDFSPWRTDYESMAKKTVIKRLLKYAPLRTDVIRAVNTDSSIKSELAVDMSEVVNEIEYDAA